MESEVKARAARTVAEIHVSAGDTGSGWGSAANLNS